LDRQKTAFHGGKYLLFYNDGNLSSQKPEKYKEFVLINELIDQVWFRLKISSINIPLVYEGQHNHNEYYGREGHFHLDQQLYPTKRRGLQIQ